jgi:cysteine synthase A
MIEDAEKRGLLGENGVVVEPTSGNTGIGVALVCAVKGYRCILTMPESMSLERRQLLAALGAEVVLTPEEGQMEGALERAREIVKKTPGAIMLQQFDNTANPSAHQRTTAEEIREDMGDLSFAAFVAGIGTGGTLSGFGRAARTWPRRPRIIAVEPESCATVSRAERGPSKIQGLAAGFVPTVYDSTVVDEVRTVTDEAAWAMKDLLAKREGLLVGISSGATVCVALDVAREIGPGAHVVTVLGDTGERYFSLQEHFRGK